MQRETFDTKRFLFTLILGEPSFSEDNLISVHFEKLQLCCGLLMGHTNLTLFDNTLWVDLKSNEKIKKYRVLIKYCVFSLEFSYFSELCMFCSSAMVFYLPGVCVHTLTPRENGVRQEFGIF